MSALSKFRTHGGVVPMHRALIRLDLPRRRILMALLLAVGFTALQVLLLDPQIMFWRALLDAVAQPFAPDVSVRMLAKPLFPGYTVWLPTAVAPEVLPGTSLLATLALLCVALYASVLWLPAATWLPVVYLVRALALVQITALAFFFLLPSYFPHRLGTYLADSLTLGLWLMLAVPWLMAMTLYLLDFSLRQKLLATGMVLGFLVVALPLQYLLHVVLVAHFSLALMPLLFLCFGLFFDVLAVIALLTFALSWDTPSSTRGNQGARHA